MPLYYLDPERQPRECPECRGADPLALPCPDCKGTGRLGVEGAEPDVEITFDGQVYWFRRPNEVVSWPRECFETETEALAAAREYYASK